MTGDNTYSGSGPGYAPTTIDPGTTLQLGAGGHTGSIVSDVVDNGTLVFDRINTVNYDGMISGAGSVVQRGPDTVRLSNENTYSGGTSVIGGGTILVTNSTPGTSSSIGTGRLTLDAGTIQAGADGLMFDNAVALGSNGGTFDTNGNTLAWTGVITDEVPGQAGALTKRGSGTLTLTGANTFGGGAYLMEGTLGVGDSGALGTGTLYMAAATTLQFAAGGLAIANPVYLGYTGNGGGGGNPPPDPTIDTGSFVETISGVVSGPGDLTKIGAGTLILTGANAYQGERSSTPARSASAPTARSGPGPSH